MRGAVKFQRDARKVKLIDPNACVGYDLQLIEFKSHPFFNQLVVAIQEEQDER